MKLYRSIEFSRLTFLIDEHHNELWSELAEKASKKTNYSNWWLQKKNNLPRHQMVKNIVSDSDAFFDKSADFNSKVGGRFNPAKSFGAIYTSACPTLSMLEVLYHVFDSSLDLYKSLKRSSDKLTTTFNVPVPETIEVLIVALELEINEPNIVNLCKDMAFFKRLCKQLGFYRYMDDNFNEDFIFGNNYEITNIIGCHYHKQRNTAVRSPSARVDIRHQKNGQYNLILPERLAKTNKPMLTGNFREYICSMDMNEVGGKHAISVQATGKISETDTVYLQSKPSKRNGRIVQFSQIDDTGESKQKFSRDVHLQRFLEI